MGAAGPAILFVILLAASAMVGVCVLAFAARCVLVLVNETAAGQDEIVWPSEPYQDWLGHAVQFIELVGIWLAPSALLARLLRGQRQEMKPAQVAGIKPSPALGPSAIRGRPKSPSPPVLRGRGVGVRG